MKLAGVLGWRLGEAPGLLREDLGLQAAQALRWAAARAAGYSLAMLGCSAHEMPLPSSSSVAPIGRLHLETTRERLNDPGPCHTVASNSYLPVAEGRAHVSTHGLTTHGALHASPFLLCDRRVRKRRVEHPAKRWGRGQEEKSGHQASHSLYVQQLIVNNFRRTLQLFGCCRTWQNNGTTSAGSLPGLLPVPPQHRKVAVPHRHGLWRTQTAHEHPTDLHRPRLDDQLEISCTEHTCTCTCICVHVSHCERRDEQGVTVRHHILSRENATGSIHHL